MSILSSIPGILAGNGSLEKLNRSVLCVENNWVNSQGVFVGDSPLKFSLPLLLLEISIMFLASSTIHYFLKHLGQSRFVSHFVAGIFLGPSILSRSKKFQDALFPERGMLVLDAISLVSFLLFLFTTGVKTNISLIRKGGRHAIIIGIAGSALPFVLAVAAYYALRSNFPRDLQHGQLVVNLAARLSLSSFPVVSDALNELKLLNSELGRVAMSASLVTDIVSWVLTCGVGVYSLTILVNTPVMGIAVLVMISTFTLFVVFVVRPAALWAVKRLPPGELLDERYFTGLVILALLSAFLTELMGFHLALGSMLVGLVLPEGMPVGTTLTEKLEPLFMGLLLPIYTVVAGIRTDFGELRSVKPWATLELVVMLCYVGKLAGTVATSMYFKMPLKHAISLALMVNIKGIVEIYFINNWGNTQIASPEHFSVLTVSMLVLSAITTPLIKFIYDPSLRYVARKCRTIQHLKPRSELRVLACIHNEDHVNAILDLLEISNASADSPISLTVLHLTELVGIAAAVVRPYKRSRHSSQLHTTSERIVNAFGYFEQHSAGAVSLHPFVAVAPRAIMHNDICALALESKARIILLPFHKQSDGAQETANRAFQSINQNVMAFAPCSVAILVDRSLPAGSTCTHTNSLLNHVGVYFLGGPDDREALAYASRMADSRSISLTVFRFLPRDETEDEDNEERKLDDEVMEEFLVRQAQNERMVYMLKLVENGEGTVAVMQDMTEKFDLLIVGRRKGMESTVTSGLSEWNECPELGIIGDMLESTEFSSKASLLVVQQQQWVEGRGEDINGGGGSGRGNGGGRRLQGGRHGQ